MKLKVLMLVVASFFLLDVFSYSSANQKMVSQFIVVSDSNSSLKKDLYILFVNTYTSGVECNWELEDYFDTGVLPNQQRMMDTCGVFGEMAVIAIEAYDAAPAAVRGDKDLVEEVVQLDRLRGIIAPKISRFRNEIQPP